MGDSAGRMPDDGYCERLVPQAPERFAALMRTKTFTNGADCELVIHLYTSTLNSVLSAAPRLTMRKNAHWGDEDMRALVEVLPLCAEATELDLFRSFMKATEEGMAVLTGTVKAGKLPPKLKRIKLDGLSDSWGRFRGSDCAKDLRAACMLQGIELEGSV